MREKSHTLPSLLPSLSFLLSLPTSLLTYLSPSFPLSLLPPILLPVLLLSLPPPTGPPTQPQKPTVSKVTSNSLKLRWSPPDYDGGSPVLSYQIEMLQLGIDQWQPIVQQPRNNFTVKTLEPSMSYKFRVIAYNEFGASKPSEPSDVVSTKGKGWFIPIPLGRKPSLSARGLYSFHLLSVWLCVSVSGWLAGWLAGSVCLSVCLAGWLCVSVCLSGWLAGWLALCICLSVCLALCVCLSGWLALCVCLSVCLAV